MRYIFLLLLFTITHTVFAQTDASAPMADALRADGKIWVVVATVLIILLGFFAYLIRVDNRLTKLEKRGTS